jgi:hypothetical protein
LPGRPDAHAKTVREDPRQHSLHSGITPWRPSAPQALPPDRSELATTPTIPKGVAVSFLVGNLPTQRFAQETGSPVLIVVGSTEKA